MILSIILAVVVAFVIAAATHMLNGGGLTEKVETRTGREQKRFAGLNKVGEYGWITAISVGVIIGLINYFTPKLSTGFLWLAPIFMAVIVFFYFGLMRWWKNDGSNWKEAVAFVILAVLFFFPMKATAAATTALWNNAFWTSFFMIIPALFLVAAIGFIIIDALYFRYREVYAVREGDTDEEARPKEHW